MKRLHILTGCLACLGAMLVAAPAFAESVKADLNIATMQGQGEAAGTVTFTDENDGVTIRTDLKGLTPGDRGFHIHTNGSCAVGENNGKMVPAGAAGGHYDPENTGKHLGPNGGGHKGDLPVLKVAADGTAKVSMHVKGLTASELKNRAIMVHEGGDNYSDVPVELGGGGGRMACGVIR